MRIAPLLPLAVIAALACDPDPDLRCAQEGARVDADAIALIDPARWTATPAELDPLADHRPADGLCEPSDWGEEYGTLEVSTAACSYVSLDQPLAADLEVGDRLRVRVWWATLLAKTPATAHLALLVDGALLWETHVDIPGSADARVFELASPIAADAGALVTFHLHNHGQNTWTLAGVERARVDDGCE